MTNAVQQFRQAVEQAREASSALNVPQSLFALRLLGNLQDHLLQLAQLSLLEHTAVSDNTCATSQSRAVGSNADVMKPFHSDNELIVNLSTICESREADRTVSDKPSESVDKEVKISSRPVEVSSQLKLRKIGKKTVKNMCSVCHKVFKHPWFFKLHVKNAHVATSENKDSDSTKSDERKGNTVQGSSQLTLRKIGTRIVTNKCHVCHKVFKRHGNLKLHVENAHVATSETNDSGNGKSEERKRNSVSPVQDYSDSQISRASLTTTKLKKFPRRTVNKCRICHQVFKYPSFLKLHMKNSHIGMSEMKSSRFSKSHGAVDVKSEDAQKNIACLIKRHSQLKLNRLPKGLYNSKCLICHKVYKYPCSLKYHLKTAHIGLLEKRNFKSLDEADLATIEERDVLSPDKSSSQSLLKAVIPSIKMVQEESDGSAPSGGLKWSKKNATSVCPICNKSFTSQYLKHHIRKHTSKQLIACTVCNKRFTYKCNLARHMQTQHNTELRNKKKNVHHQRKAVQLTTSSSRVVGSRTYCVCAICEKQYKNASHLKYHMQEKHGDQTGQVASEPLNRDVEFKTEITALRPESIHSLSSHEYEMVPYLHRLQVVDDSKEKFDDIKIETISTWFGISELNDSNSPNT